MGSGHGEVFDAGLVITQLDELVGLTGHGVQPFEGQDWIFGQARDVQTIAVAHPTDIHTTWIAGIREGLDILPGHFPVVRNAPVPGTSGEEHSSLPRAEAAAIILSQGVTSDPLTVDEVQPLPVAGDALLPGDEILAIAGRETPAIEDAASSAPSRLMSATITVAPCPPSCRHSSRARPNAWPTAGALPP